MKQLIILVASVMLGLFLFDLICGEQQGSVMSTVKSVWSTEIEARTQES